MSATPAFDYIALDRAGLKSRGTVRAAAELDAYRQIAAAGLTPVRIRPARARATRRRVSLKEVASFTYQLSVLIGARIPIGDGLRGLAEQQSPGKFRDTITAIASKIESGSRIADAMADHTAVFGELYIEAVRAAEQSGNLVKVLEYLSETLERQVEMRQQLRSAMTYPACVVGALSLAVMFLVGFVVPKFARMYEQRKMDLPIFTKLLVAFGDSIHSYWWAYLLAIVAATFGVRTAWRRPAPRARIERALHRIPYLRDVLVGSSVARFARVLGLCLNSGLSLIDSIQMAGRASGRPALQRDALRLAERVRAGGKLSSVLLACDYLPPFAKRMLTSGEESAELGKMCSVIARQYERDTASLTKNVSTVIEPLLIMMIGAAVLVVALAIFLPMWNMVKLMS